jgi:hypothetical protein
MFKQLKINKMTLTNSLLNNFRMLSNVVFITVLIVVFIAYFFDISDQSVLLELVLPLTLVFTAPTLVLHYNHYLNSKGGVFELTKSGIIKKEKMEVMSYSVNDIREITFYMTRNRETNSATRELAFEDYHYGKIIMTNGESIIITCLFSHKLDKILPEMYPDVKVSKIRRFYTFIS